MRFACQILLLVLIGGTLLRGLWQDLHGIKAHPPFGFSGVIVTLIAAGLLFLVYWGAGALSLIFGGPA